MIPISIQRMNYGNEIASTVWMVRKKEKVGKMLEKS